MGLDDVRSLYRYNVWANARFFAALEALAPDVLATPIVSSFPSLLATLGHLVGAEWIWLRRWQGESPTAFPTWLEGASLADLRARLSAIESERGGFLDGLDDERLRAPLAYRLLSGDGSSNPLSDLLLHVVNHSSYHRGQLTTMLRQVGAAPPATDYIVFKRS